jgi:hypothetical protein
VKVFNQAAARTGLRDNEARAAGFDPVTIESGADDHKAYYLGSHRITMRVTGDRATGRLLGMRPYGHKDAEIAKRADIAAPGTPSRQAPRHGSGKPPALAGYGPCRGARHPRRRWPAIAAAAVALLALAACSKSASTWPERQPRLAAPPHAAPRVWSASDVALELASRLAEWRPPDWDCRSAEP